ncbi:hypothetical protein AB7303_18840 [Providencia rettgeri]
MRNRKPLQSEDQFINNATSIPEIANNTNKRVRKYKAISTSLTEQYIEDIDNLIHISAVDGLLNVSRSDVIKAALDNFNNLSIDEKILKIKEVKG